MRELFELHDPVVSCQLDAVAVKGVADVPAPRIKSHDVKYLRNAITFIDLGYDLVFRHPSRAPFCFSHIVDQLIDSTSIQFCQHF